jgi:hypothetical protein
MADAWSVFIIYEGPRAADKVGALMAQACDDNQASFVMGGPGMPDWDFGAMQPGWEKHEYDLGRPAPAATAPVPAPGPEVSLSPDFATTYKEFRCEDFGDCLRAATLWIEANYGDANPLAITTHYTDDGWTIGVVIERT